MTSPLPGPAAAELDERVGSWYTVPDLCELLDLDVGKVRQLLRERWIVAIRRGERNVLSVPADFVVVTEGSSPVGELVVPLRGTLTVLADAGLTDADAIEWLFTPDDALGSTPIAALRSGRRTAVRRIAQTL